MLQLNLAEAETFPAYQLELLSGTGEALWRTTSLRRRADGTFTAFVPPGFLTPGAYRIELTGTGPGRTRRLADYALVVQP
jgi:hypothetical protein